MKPDRYRGGFLCAGLSACTLAFCFVPVAGLSDTNFQTTARSRDDKNATINLALQVAQQLQTQQRQTEAASRQTAESVASLRRLTLFVGAGLGIGLLTLLVYARRMVRLLQRRAFAAPIPPAPPADALARKGATLEQLHRLEDALACYEQAIALDAKFTGAYVGKGRVLNQLERYREALDCFERASQLQPHGPPRAAA